MSVYPFGIILACYLEGEICGLCLPHICVYPIGLDPRLILGVVDNFYFYNCVEGKIPEHEVADVFSDFAYLSLDKT